MRKTIFLASFYMMGISFIDMAFLKVENIVDGRILYTRKKTHRPYNIKISASLEVILQYYSKGKNKGDYLFPILKQDSLPQQYKRLKEARKRYNKKLKKLAVLADIDEHLTSYVSRHTFASLANNKGIPVSAISEMLGHESLKTTQIYLNSLSNNILDNYNDMIIDI
ncbi:site-specific integrase [Tenacibaculum litopenaei]|uniref:site-specific integrase n=1 Tax=Tenacibaculum litopenaei TaxID=396016 RepID=UPI0038B69E52